MDDDKVNSMFTEMVGADALGEVVGALHTIYAEAMRKGFPEERAWQLAENLIDKLWKSAEPFIQAEVKKHL